MSKEMTRPHALGKALLALILCACSGPLMKPETLKIKQTQSFKHGAFVGKKVAFMPLAVTDDLGDARSGLSLSRHTREQASDAACETLADYWSDPLMICLDDTVTASNAVSDAQQRFALDQPFPKESWQSLRSATGADYVLLFRPEGATSSQQVSRKLTYGAGEEGMSVGVGTFGAGNLVGNTTLRILGTSTAVASLLALPNARKATVNTTEVTYTVSASLVDLRTGNLLRVGVYTDGDSNTARKNQGYAEGPPVAPILERIMVQLGYWVLDDPVQTQARQGYDL